MQQHIIALALGASVFAIALGAGLVIRHLAKRQTKPTWRPERKGNAVFRSEDQDGQSDPAAISMGGDIGSLQRNFPKGRTFKATERGGIVEVPEFIGWEIPVNDEAHSGFSDRPESTEEIRKALSCGSFQKYVEPHHIPSEPVHSRPGGELRKSLDRIEGSVREQEGASVNVEGIEAAEIRSHGVEAETHKHGAKGFVTADDASTVDRNSYNAPASHSSHRSPSHSVSDYSPSHSSTYDTGSSSTTDTGSPASTCD